MKILLAFLLILPVLCLGQSSSKDKDVVIGEKITVHSDILNEDREIWIGLPDNYSDKNKYPVFYLLDGKTMIGHRHLSLSQLATPTGLVT